MRATNQAFRLFIDAPIEWLIEFKHVMKANSPSTLKRWAAHLPLLPTFFTNYKAPPPPHPPTHKYL